MKSQNQNSKHTVPTTVFEKYETFERRQSKRIKAQQHGNEFDESPIRNGPSSATRYQSSRIQSKPKNPKADQQKLKDKELKLEKKRIKDEQIQQANAKEYIGHIQQVPAYMANNEYIATGYRINFNTIRKLLRSLFMIHNESVNIWSHLIGASIFVALIVYTTFYLAPPVIKSSQNLDQSWLFDISLLKSRDSETLKSILNQSHHQTSPLGSQGYDDEINTFNEQQQQLLEETLLSDMLEHNAQQNNNAHNPHASLFESLELYLFHAIYVVADPQLYVRCYQSLARYTQLIKNMPSHLEKEIESALTNLYEIDVYQHKVTYLKQLLKFLRQKIDNWSDDLNVLINSEDFDFLELKPIFSEDPHKLVHYVSRIPLFIHMASALTCLGCSAIYHLFKDHSQPTQKALAKFDYAGISILIAGSNTPPIFYSMFCDDMIFWRNAYLGLTYAFCLSCFVVLFAPKFNNPKFRVVRGITFVVSGLLSAVPLLQFEYLTDPIYLQEFKSFPWALGGALYILGAVFYMLRVPERFAKGRFDIVGSSHQLFHLLIIVAALVHYRASINCFHDRQIYQCPVKAFGNEQFK